MKRPYPNEHAVRLLDPDQFDDFRRETDGLGAGIDVIWGIKAGRAARMQGLRFDAARYSEAEAWQWLVNTTLRL